MMQLQKELINLLTIGKHAEMNIKLDLVRLGTKYENNNTLNPVYGVSNGTVIGFWRLSKI